MPLRSFRHRFIGEQHGLFTGLPGLLPIRIRLKPLADYDGQRRARFGRLVEIEQLMLRIARPLYLHRYGLHSPMTRRFQVPPLGLAPPDLALLFEAASHPFSARAACRKRAPPPRRADESAGAGCVGYDPAATRCSTHSACCAGSASRAKIAPHAHAGILRRHVPLELIGGSPNSASSR